MSTIRWLTFGFVEPALRTIVHLFPSTSSLGAPHAVNCKITMFARSLSPRSVVLEGARIGQPDGVRLEELFGTPQELAAGPVGLEIELSSSQPRVDLSPSSCIVEVVGLPYPVRFEGLSDVAKFEQGKGSPDTFLVNDNFTKPSLMVVNGSDKELRPEQLKFEVVDPEGRALEVSFLNTRVPPFAVVECRVPDHAVSEQMNLSCSWGTMKGCVLRRRGESSEEISLFLLNRHTRTGTPLSAFNV